MAWSVTPHVSCSTLRRYPGRSMRNRALPAIAFTGCIAALTWTTLRAQKPAAQPAAPAIEFVRDIQPILRTHCYECHGPKKSKNGLRLDLRTAAMKGGDSGAAIVPGDSAHSLIVRRLLGLDGDDQMPKDKDPLARAE